MAKAETHTSDLVCEMRDETHALMPRIEARLDRMEDDIAALKVRLTRVETVLTAIGDRVDRLEIRLQRIERWLELVED